MAHLGLTSRLPDHPLGLLRLMDDLPFDIPVFQVKRGF